MSFSLGIDASTQSCSGIVIDTKAGKVVAKCSINYGSQLPHYDSPYGFIPNRPEGEVHADPRLWLDALEMLLGALTERCDLSRVAAISGAAQQHGTVYLNDSWERSLASLNTSAALSVQLAPCLSRPTSPIWLDTSTATQCREIADAMGGDWVVCEKSGSVPTERFAGPQIRRFSKTNTAAYQSTTRIHLISSFLCSVLSGSDAPIDIGDGAGMNLLNIKLRQWDEKLVEATAPDLHPKLPEVVTGERITGYISDYFVKNYGLRPGTPVSVFTGDNPSSLVGMGASAPGKVVISLGTSDTLFSALSDFIVDPSGCGHVFGNPAGGYLALQCFANGSLARERVKAHFGLDWVAFERLLARTPPGNTGQLMLPFFEPEISPRLRLEQPILKGTTLFEEWGAPDAAIRACVEGQAINMKCQTEWMLPKPDEIYLTGGASENEAITQVFANVFQAEMKRLETADSVALGAAMRAANNSLGLTLADLESAFCNRANQRSTLPDTSVKATYAELEGAFQEQLKACISSPK